MATTTTHILVRRPDGTPALWAEIVDTEYLRDDGTRFHDYSGSTLNDDRTSIPFDPATESFEDVAMGWLRATESITGLVLNI